MQSISCAEYMRLLRVKRKRDGQCSRCGAFLTTDEIGEGRSCCGICLKYKERYRNGEIEPKKNTTYFYNRKGTHEKIKRHTLANAMIENKVSVSELSFACAVSARTIERILYSDLPISRKTVTVINRYFRKRVLCFPHGEDLIRKGEYE